MTESSLLRNFGKNNLGAGIDEGGYGPGGTFHKYEPGVISPFCCETLYERLLMFPFH